jgi:hypothetical protein
MEITGVRDGRFANLCQCIGLTITYIKSRRSRCFERFFSFKAQKSLNYGSGNRVTSVKRVSEEVVQ